MKYNIHIYGDPVLREVTEEVTEFDSELRDFVDNMTETMYEGNGIGLAAPQVGISRKIIVIDFSFGESTDNILAIINPEIIEAGGECVMEEGCLSVPGIYEDVTRPEKIKISYRDVEGNLIETEADGMLARVMQHESDHLAGVLFTDRLSTVKRDLLAKTLRTMSEKGGEN